MAWGDAPSRIPPSLTWPPEKVIILSSASYLISASTSWLKIALARRLFTLLLLTVRIQLPNLLSDIAIPPFHYYTHQQSKNTNSSSRIPRYGPSTNRRRGKRRYQERPGSDAVVSSGQYGSRFHRQGALTEWSRCEYQYLIFLVPYGIFEMR
jgi:hypothetical protein